MTDFSQTVVEIERLRVSENMASNYIVLFGVATIALGTVSAITELERVAIRAAALPVLIECGKEVGITKEQVLKAKDTKNSDILDPCFYACFFKKSGIINEKGVYDADAILEKHKKYINGEDDLKKIADIANICTSVNEKEVGDGTKGCERAKLLVHCLLEHKSTLTPFA